MAALISARIRDTLKDAAWLKGDISTVADDDDLYGLGLTSHATVNLMLALEEAFDIEFPDHLLRRQTFGSITSMVQALGEMGVHREAA